MTEFDELEDDCEPDGDEPEMSYLGRQAARYDYDQNYLEDE